MLPRDAAEGVGLVNTYSKWALMVLQGCDKDTDKADLGNNEGIKEQESSIEWLPIKKENSITCNLCTNEEKASKQTLQKVTEWRRRNSINSVRIQGRVGQEVERGSSQKKGEMWESSACPGCNHPTTAKGLRQPDALHHKCLYPCNQTSNNSWIGLSRL